jgi:hypothetical protein
MIHAHDCPPKVGIPRRAPDAARKSSTRIRGELWWDQNETSLHTSPLLQKRPLQSMHELEVIPSHFPEIALLLCSSKTKFWELYAEITVQDAYQVSHLLTTQRDARSLPRHHNISQTYTNYTGKDTLTVEILHYTIRAWIWPWVLRDFDPRVTALAKAQKQLYSKLQTRPLVREGAQNNKTATV